ncbi:NB-ARC domain-containing protein [Streptomyces sp. NPDC041068]|uniref:ATP-binding protein n=1 Tax=Streptomyces sp. NPDC041068 TaxID=3155130 RepID=UPI00340E83B2
MLRNLPDETTPFVGRCVELDRLASALRERRLVTVTGGAGLGKSRLALRVVSSGGWEGFSAVGWADLWPLKEGASLAAFVADALDLSDHTSRALSEAVCEWIGDRRVLLVLDSCEHLVPGCRRLVAELLTVCPRLTVLATSRERLGVPGESVLVLEPLDPATDAVDLFAQRARAAGRPLRDAEDRRVAAELCSRLEGVPLALELAAGLLSRSSLAEAAVLIRTGLEVPDRPDVRPPRHRQMRTAVGWSHELCRPVERLLWARLSVLPGPFDIERAERVCAGGPLTVEALHDALAGLVRKSVVSERDATYRMLDSVREYGRMWLGQLGEEASVAGRQAALMVEMTRQARQEWLGSGQQYWYARMRELYRDVCVAMDFLLDADDASALELAGNVAFFWICSGRLHEAVRYLRIALELTAEHHPRRGRALWSLALARILQGELGEGRALAAESLRVASRQGDAEGVRQAVYLEGLSALLDGRPLYALNRADEALRSIPEPRDSSAARHEGPRRVLTFGVVLCRLVRIFALTGGGWLKEAREEGEVLRRECQRLGEYWTRSYVDYQLALIALFEDRSRAAESHARNMLDAKRRIGDQFGLAMGLDLLGASWAEQGEAERAVIAFGAGSQYWRAVGLAQRGTPEATTLRDQTMAHARTQLGEAMYEQLLRKAESTAPEALLRSALGE